MGVFDGGEVSQVSVNGCRPDNPFVVAMLQASRNASKNAVLSFEKPWLPSGLVRGEEKRLTALAAPIRGSSGR